VCVKTIHFVVPSGGQQALDSFNSGQYQAAYMRDPVVMQKWATEKPRVGNAVRMLVVGASNIYINTASKSAHLDDERVRQAIDIGIDRNAISQRGYQGTLTVHSSLAPKGNGIVAPTTGPKYDLTKARKLLSQVKSDTGWDGTLRVLGTQSSVDPTIALAAVLNQIGFKTTTDTSKSIPAYITDIIGGNYDVALGGFQGVNGDYWGSIFTRSTSQPLNFAHLNDPTWTAAVDELLTTPVGSKAYDKVLAKVQTVHDKIVPDSMIGSYDEVTLVQNKLKGLQYTYSLIPLFGKMYLAKS
jgi:peptide/nickel transport system substrate-binding protein